MKRNNSGGCRVDHGGEEQLRRLQENVSYDRFPDDFAPSLDAARDHSWTIARTIGILTMQGGFALLEAGSVRPANRANIMMKNVADMSVGLLLYAAYGYSITFTENNAFIGGASRFLLIGADREYTHVLHQFSFAATTGTIVSGVLAERVCFKAYVLLSSVIISFLYSTAAHWVWTSEGWLAQINFIDFAGAGVVHLLGGACAFVATWVVGPRIGRFGALPPWLLKWTQFRQRLYARFAFKPALDSVVDKALDASAAGMKAITRKSVASEPAAAAPEASAPAAARNSQAGGGGAGTLRREQIARVKEAQQFKVSDPVNVIYGTFILFVGWISFNCSGTYGLTGGREHLAARVGVVTCIGGASGTLAGLLYSNAATRGEAFEIEPASIGALAGLVSITAGCANMGVWEGALSGFTGGVLACCSRGWLEHCQIDDPVGAIPVHFVGGIWGLLVVGLFNRSDGYGVSSLPGLAHGGGAHLLGVQLIGTLVLIAWGALCTWALLAIMRKVMCLRVTKEQEQLGLDVTEHGIRKAGMEERKKKPPLAMRPAAVVRKVKQRINRLSGRESTPKSPKHVEGEEFVEDVGHAANVKRNVRYFATTLRQRAIETKEASSAEVEVEVESEPGSSVHSRSELGAVMAVAAAGGS